MNTLARWIAIILLELLRETIDAGFEIADDVLAELCVGLLMLEARL